MLYHNQYGVDPGVYVYGDITIVVSNVVTHAIVDGVEQELDDPEVVFRSIQVNVEKHKAFKILLSEFRSKFKKG